MRRWLPFLLLTLLAPGLWAGVNATAPSASGYENRNGSLDPAGYIDGYSLYAGYFAPNGLDPTGLFKGTYHRQITKDALSGSGLSKKCIDIIAEADVDLDAGVYTNSGPFADSLNHGDNGLIAETIRRMTERAKKVLDTPCSDCKGMEDAWKELGRMFHSLQDLYAHSNYVELNGGTVVNGKGGNAKVGSISLWNMWGPGLEPNVPTGVTSGNYEWPDHGAPPSHAEMNKDEPGSPRGQMKNMAGVSNFDLARDLATRHTRHIWGTLVGVMPAAMKKAMNECCGNK